MQSRVREIFFCRIDNHGDSKKFCMIQVRAGDEALEGGAVDWEALDRMGFFTCAQQIEDAHRAPGQQASNRHEPACLVPILSSDVLQFWAMLQTSKCAGPGIFHTASVGSCVSSGMVLSID